MSAPGRRIKVGLGPDGTTFTIFEYRLCSDGTWMERWTSTIRFPDRKTVLSGIEVGLTDTTVKIISELCPTEYEVVFEDESAKLAFDFLKASDAMQCQVAAKVADFKSSGKIPQFEYIDNDVLPLANFQKVGLYASLNLDGYGYFMEQGTGKTAVAIATICNDSLKTQGKYVGIVVCPNNVRMNWEREISKFATVPVRTTVLRGSQVNRLTQIVSAIRATEKVSMIVCSYETLCQSWEALGRIKFNIAILDEAQYIKSPMSRRWEYTKKLRDNALKRLVLTGTPIANSIMDLYTLFEFMGEGYCGFKTWQAYRQYYGTWRSTPHGQMLDGVQNIPLLKERIAKLSFIVKKAEVLPDLPDKLLDIAEVEMTEEQKLAYVKLRNELVIEIESMLDSAKSEAIAVNNVLTQLLRLSQITAGFKVIPAQYDLDGNKISDRIVIPFKENPKVEYIKSLVQEKGPNDKTIIWSCWVESIKAVEAALIEMGEEPVTFYGGTSEADRIEAERKFNFVSKCRWFIGNPAAGGTGLNLLGYPPGDSTYPTNCNHVIYLSQNWSMLHRAQSEDRAHRRGTREPVRITDLCVPNSIDEVIRCRVAEKRLHAEDMTDLKAILMSIKGALE